MNQISKKSNAHSDKNTQTSIRVLGTTRDEVKKIFDKVNDKEFGGKTTNDDIILEALKCLVETKGKIEELKLKNLSVDDEENYAYKKYNETNDPVSWDEFKRKLRRGELLKFMKSLGFEV